MRVVIFQQIQSLRKESEGGVNLVYSYNLGDVNHAVTLSGVNITDGKWHHVIVTRYGTKAELKVDVDGFWFSTKGTAFGVSQYVIATMLNLVYRSLYIQYWVKTKSYFQNVSLTQN